MNILILTSLISILAIFPNNNSNLKATDDPHDVQFNIDIKKNFKNIKTIRLSSIGKELSFIPLETTPNCLIQNIYKIEISSSYFFIRDFERLLQFDRNGKFIRQIGSSGRGPEQYYSVFDFCINEQKKEISIISTSQLMIFGFDGIFKNSYKLSFRPSQIIPKDQNSLMYHLASVPGKNDPSWIISNQQGITSSIIKNNLMRKSQPGLIVPYSPLYLFNSTVHFMEFGIDTLYYFKNTLKKPYAVFFLDDLKMDTDPLITQSMVKNHEFLTDKISIGSIFENNDFLFIKFFRGISDATICAVFNKKTNAVTFPQDDVFQNDLGGGVGFWPKQIANDNILVDYADAYDLLKKIIPSNLRIKLTETSNPVLMFLK